MIKPSETINKWDKIKGINGKIVRFKCDGEKEHRVETLSKIRYKKLYVGVENGILYSYYEILG